MLNLQVSTIQIRYTAAKREASTTGETVWVAAPGGPFAVVHLITNLYGALHWDEAKSHPEPKIGQFESFPTNNPNPSSTEYLYRSYELLLDIAPYSLMNEPIVHS